MNQITTAWGSRQINLSDNTYQLPVAARVGVGESAYLSLRCTRKNEKNVVVEKMLHIRADTEEMELFLKTTKAVDSEYCATGCLEIRPNGEMWMTNLEFHKSTIAIVVETSINIGGKLVKQETLQIIHMQQVKLRIHRNGELFMGSQTTALKMDANGLKQQITTTARMANRTDIREDGRTVLPRVCLMEHETLVQQIEKFTSTATKKVVVL